MEGIEWNCYYDNPISSHGYYLLRIFGCCMWASGWWCLKNKNIIDEIASEWERESEIWTDEDKNVILIEWPDVDGGELHQQNKTFSFDWNVFTFSKQFINNSMLNLIFYIILNESESIHFTLSCSLSRVGHQKLFNQNSSKPYS